MSAKTERPMQDRSKRLNDAENNEIIRLVEREDGVVCIFL